MKPVYFLLISFLCFSFSAAALHNGSISGLITETGAGLELAGAVIRLEPGGRYTTSNEIGYFSFQNLPAGTYTLNIQLIGYEVKNIPNIEVRDTESSVLRILLAPQPLDLEAVDIATPVSQPFQTISALDIQTRPINSTQDVLRTVPGLFIAQHAGGGKAEQLFLRGFDIDHGTDVSISVDGAPVNMVSHAHGQGYADLHFVIPELVEKVDFNKGPYEATAGDFTTAGSVRFKTMDALDHNLIKVEGAQFNTARAVGAFNLLGQGAERRNRHAYLAAETMYSDGYFDAPQALKRLNVQGKYSALLDDQQRVSFTASAFSSSWDASGQVPERAIASGAITRFGAIDPTEGGQTSRYNLIFEHMKSRGSQGLWRNQLYYTRYAFELYSNFTFFLNDPVNGDGIRQREKRHLFGYSGSYRHQGHILQSEIGVFLRSDQTSGSELSRVRARAFKMSGLALGNIAQTNSGAYWSEKVQLGAFTMEAALRADIFQFAYENQLDSLYAPQRETAGIVSPKVKLNYTLGSKTQLYFHAGSGFHSNDTRVVVAQRAEQALPRALGADLGVVFKPAKGLLVQLAAWRLALEQEFVYVGDEAVVEAGGKTRRSGLDLSLRGQMARHLFVDADITYSHARSVEAEAGAQNIPLAPVFTGTAGLNWDKGSGFFGSLRSRYLGNRPANEDNSVRAEGYFLLDVVAGWKWKQVEASITVQNLLNTAWKEAQFDTESRLKDELEPVSEIHFTPGTPFFLKGGLSIRF
jgi:outer membrane cobalamin receptor